MRVFMTCPTLRPHGGTRVILEWANRLPDVVLRVPKLMPVDWMTVGDHVRIVTDDAELSSCDTLIVSSPHAVDYLNNRHAPARRFAFLQMLEDMFKPDNIPWRRKCASMYTTPHPLILISKWNERIIRHQHNRTAPTFYVGNGISLTDFPIDATPKDGRTVLVEGWNAGNPTKDTDRIAPDVAARLRHDGYRITAYAGTPPTETNLPVDEFHVTPDLATLNRLYREATILIKATRYDARSCAPIEAMTKGTPTVRALIEGDDDLDHDNSVRVDYEADALYFAARNLLTDPSRLATLSANCLRYAEAHSWDKVWPEIEEVLT